MNNKVIFEGIEQLITIYARAESQYCHASLLVGSPLIREFLEFRAFERMHFIEELEYAISLDPSKTYEGLCEWHVQIYGHNPINEPLVTSHEVCYSEVKALEVCTGLLASNLPENLVNLLWMHVCKIEACLLSMAYLSALFEKRY